MNLHKSSDISLSRYNLSSIRLVNTFRNYFAVRAVEAKKLRDHHEELSLEYALSQIFSPKQKELFLKKLKGENMTKTEKEYFSRTVKKKILALSNPELHRLSQQVISSWNISGAMDFIGWGGREKQTLAKELIHLPRKAAGGLK